LATRLTKLSNRIQLELVDIEQAILRSQAGWQQYQSSGDDLYLDSVALNLHSFYNGLERLFEAIATTIDNHLPGSSNWHKALLEQMVTEVPNVRPAVISDSTLILLDDYRRFRHLVRNIYGYHLDPAQMKGLLDNAPVVLTQTQQELLDFASWLIQYPF
jgi:hypothetical protein